MSKDKMRPFSSKHPRDSEAGKVISAINDMYMGSGLYDERKPGPADAIRGALFFYARFHGLPINRDKISDLDRLRLDCSERHMEDRPGEPLRPNLDGREILIPKAEA